MTTPRSAAKERQKGRWQMYCDEIGFRHLQHQITGRHRGQFCLDGSINIRAGRLIHIESGGEGRQKRLSAIFRPSLPVSSFLALLPHFLTPFCFWYHMYVGLRLYLFPAANCLTWKNYKTFENKAGGNETEKGIVNRGGIFTGEFFSDQVLLY